MLTADSLPPAMIVPRVAAETVDERTAMRLADVYSCVRVLCDAITTAPLVAYRDTDAGRVKLTGGTGPNLLRRPAPGVTQSTFMAGVMRSLCLWGEAFIGKIRTAGEITSLEVLSPDRVSVWVENGQPFYRYEAPLGAIFDRLTPADVIHVRGLTDAEGVRGLSPIRACAESLGLAASLTTAASALWANGAVPAGVISVGSGVMAQDEIDRVTDGWAQRHQGPKARGRVAVMRGDFDFKAVSMPLADAEFIATRNLSTAEIARIFRVPTSLISASSGDSLTYKTTESESMHFATYSLGAPLRLIEEAIGLDDELLPGQNAYCRFDLSDLLRADTQTRYATYAVGLGAGFLTVDEVRDAEDMGPMPDHAPPDPAAAAFAQRLANTAMTGASADG